MEILYILLFCVCWYILGVALVIKIILLIDDFKVKDLFVVLFGGFLGGALFLLIPMVLLNNNNNIIIKKK
jgi:hypothetical protein